MNKPQDVLRGLQAIDQVIHQPGKESDLCILFENFVISSCRICFTQQAVQCVISKFNTKL